MSPLRSIPPVTSTSQTARRRLRSADPVRHRTRTNRNGQSEEPPLDMGEYSRDGLGGSGGGQQPQQRGGSRGPVSWGGGIGRAERGGGGGGVGSAATLGSHTYTKGQHLAAKPEPQKTHKALSCSNCGATGTKLSGSIWYRDFWWVDCLVCDSRQLAKEVA